MRKKRGMKKEILMGRPNEEEVSKDLNRYIILDELKSIVTDSFRCFLSRFLVRYKME